MNGLSARQRECLSAIKDLTVDGVSPSYDEIQDRLRLASKSGVHRLLHGLKDRGHIEFEPGHGRSVRVIGAGFSPDELNKMSDEALRNTIALSAGILAYREGGYGKETAEVLRRVADKMVRQ